MGIFKKEEPLPPFSSLLSFRTLSFPHAAQPSWAMPSPHRTLAGSEASLGLVSLWHQKSVEGKGLLFACTAFVCSNRHPLHPDHTFLDRKDPLKTAGLNLALAVSGLLLFPFLTMKYIKLEFSHSFDLYSSFSLQIL